MFCFFTPFLCSFCFSQVLSLKEKVAEKNKTTADMVRLAFAGRVLKNDDTIEASKVKENDTMIAIISKMKAPSPAPAPAPTPAAAPAPATAPAAAPAQAPETAPAPASTSESAPAPAPVPVPAEPAPTQGGAVPAEPIPAPQPASQPAQTVAPPSEDTVAMLVSMGFPRDYALAALRAAHNDPSLAVHFLTEGMPMDGDDEGDDGSDDDGGHGMGGSDDEPGELPETAMSDPAMFQALISNPQFQQLRTLLRAQPQMLETMLNQFQQANPAIYRIIMNNRDAFSRWLSDDSVPAPVPGAGTGAGAGSVPVPAPAPAQQVHRIEATPEDRAAIERLVALGFSESAALQAYFACDKNVDLAANFLFENGGDF